MQRANRSIAIAFMVGAVGALGVPLGGCAPEGPRAMARVRLGLPLSSHALELGIVDVTQEGVTLRLAADVDGVVQVSLRTDVPAEIAATLLGLDQTGDAPGLFAYVGAASVMPTAATTTVDIDLVALPSIEGSVIAAFDGVYDLVRNVPLNVVDHDTGFFVAAAFTTGATFKMPAERAIGLTLAYGGTDYTLELGLTAAFAPGLRLNIGAAPALPSAPDLAVAKAALDSAAIVRDPGLPVACALGTQCDAPDLVFTSCDVALRAGLETVYDFLVRYSEVPSLGCGFVKLTVDDTPPEFSLSATPPFLSGGAPYTLTWRANEALEPASLKVTGPAGITVTGCASPSVLDVEGRLLTCSITLSGWSAGDVDLRASAADAAGNTLTVPLRLLDPAALATAGFAAVAVTSRPAVVSPIEEAGFTLAVDVANFGASDICKVTLVSLSLLDPGAPAMALLSAFPLGNPIATLTAAGTASSTGRLLAQSSMRIQAPQTQPSGLDDGIYEIDVTVSAEPCTAQVPTTSTVKLPILLRRHDPRWLGGGKLVFSEWTASSSACAVGAMPLMPTPSMGTPLGVGIVAQSDNDKIMAVITKPRAFVLADGLTAGLPGKTTLVAKYDETLTPLPATPLPPPSVTEVEVVPGPGIGVLQPSFVTLHSGSTDTAYAIAAAVGGAKRVLWEPENDWLIAVGPTGAQIVNTKEGVAAPVFASDCGTLEQATLAALEPVTSRTSPTLAVVATDLGGNLVHCEFNLATHALTYQQAFSAASLAACGAKKPVRLESDPLADTFVLVLDGCVLRYKPGTGTLAETVTIGTMNNTLGAADLARGFAYTADASFSLLDTVGANGLMSMPWTKPGTGTATAMAVDARSGLPRFAYDSLIYWHATARYASIAAPQTDGSFTVPVTAMTVDAGCQQLWAADTAVPPALWRTRSDIIGNPVAAGALGDGTPVVEMIVVGPQPFAASPARVLPGGVLIVYGRGFAADAEAFVQGIPAKVLAVGGTWLQLRVPLALADSSAWSSALLVGVRSHQRLGQGQVRVTLEQSSEQIVTGPGSSAPLYTSTASTPGVAYALVNTLEGPLAMHSDAMAPGVFAPSLAPMGGLSIMPQTPSEARATTDGTRLVGYDSGSNTFIDRWLGDFYSAVETARAVLVPGGALNLSRLALDPKGRLLAAAQVDGALTPGLGLYRLNDFSPVGPQLSLVAGQTGVDGLGFFPDGSLLAAAQIGRLAQYISAYSLTDQGATPMPVLMQMATCPTATVSYLLKGIFPRFTDHAELLFVLEADATVLVTATLAASATGQLVFACQSSNPTHGALTTTTLNAAGTLLATVIVGPGAGAPDQRLRLFHPDALGTALVDQTTVVLNQSVSSLSAFLLPVSSMTPSQSLATGGEPLDVTEVYAAP